MINKYKKALKYGDCLNSSIDLNEFLHLLIIIHNLNVA